MVYDAVKDTYTPIDAYECRPERRYTRQEAAQIVATDGTYGPWHNSDAELIAQNCKEDPEYAEFLQNRPVGGRTGLTHGSPSLARRGAS
jgi:hypothetical protein